MITIYVIYHTSFENTNIFTTDFNKINTLIEYMAKKTYTDIHEWKYKKIIEEESFQADMS